MTWLGFLCASAYDSRTRNCQKKYLKLPSSERDKLSKAFSHWLFIVVHVASMYMHDDERYGRIKELKNISNTMSVTKRKSST